MTPWVQRLLWANVLVYLLTLAVPHLVEAGMFVPALILFRPWTILTYMFLHGGLGHVFFNLLSLFFFGPRVEDRLGGRHFIGLYLVSGFAGALLSFVNPTTPIIGASGAVFGVTLAYAQFWPRAPIYIWGVVPVEARWLVLFMTGLSLLGGTGAVGPGIAHFAHLGGFAGGWLYLRVLRRRSSATRWAEQVRSPSQVGVSREAMERWARIRPEELHEVNRTELERIRSKLKAGGPEALSPGDLEFLDRFSTR